MDGPSRQCGACGYDLRGSGRSGRCPECGADLTTIPNDPTTIADQSGLDLVAGSLLASVPAVSGVLLFGLIGRIAAVLAALWLGFRLAGMLRLHRGPLRAAVPPELRRVLWTTTIAELATALPAALMLIVSPGLPSPRLWSIATFGAWSLVAGLGLIAIAITMHGVARRLETAWASGAATIGAVLCLIATVSTLILTAVAFGIASAPAAVRGTGMPGALVTIALMIVGPLSAIAGVLLLRMLLLSIESHVVTTAMEALRPRRDPLREIGVPVRSIEASAATDHDPLPLEPAKPPVRDDL